MRILSAINIGSVPGHEVLTCDPGQIAEHLQGVDVLVPAIGLVDRSVLGRGSFGLVHQSGVGLDSIDIDAATDLGVWVAHVPSDRSGNAASVAEHAVFLALAVSRRLHETQTALAARKTGQPVGSMLMGKTACVIGLGNVGSRIAQRLRAFEMTLVGVSPRPVTIEGVTLKALYTPDQLAGSVAGADYVFVCASGDKTNTGLIDRRILSSMKRGAFLVNVARGRLVDPSALLDALQSGHLAGAGLDVFAKEPVDPKDPLPRAPNVVATPHVAGATDIVFTRTLDVLRRDLDAYARGERFPGLVNEPPRPRHALGSA